MEEQYIDPRNVRQKLERAVSRLEASTEISIVLTWTKEMQELDRPGF